MLLTHMQIAKKTASPQADSKIIEVNWNGSNHFVQRQTREEKIDAGAKLTEFKH